MFPKCKFCGEQLGESPWHANGDDDDECELRQLRKLRDVIVHNAGTKEPVIDFTLAVKLARQLKAASI